MPRKRIFTEEERREIAAIEGISTHAIAREYNISAQSVLNYRKEFGFTHKIAKTAPRPRPKLVKKERDPSTKEIMGDEYDQYHHIPKSQTTRLVIKTNK